MRRLNRVLCFLLWVGIVLSPFAAGAGTPPDSEAARRAPVAVQRTLYKAQIYTERNQQDKALSLLQGFVRNHPDQNHCLVEFTMGNILYSQGHVAQALEHFRAAAKLDPEYGPAWVNLGQTAFEQNQYRLAAEALSRGYRTSEPRNPEHRYYSGVAFIMAKDYDQAIATLEPLVATTDTEPRKEWFQSLLHACVAGNRTSRAAEVIDRMLDLYGADPETWRLLYQFEANRGNYRGAAVAMTIYEYLTPLTRGEQILLGDLYININVPEQACKHYEIALAEGNATPAELERLASAYVAAHKPEKARAALRRGLHQAPTARLWSLLGDLDCMDENYDGALKAFRETARLDPGNGRAHLMMGYCALQLGRTREAVAALRKAAADPRQKKSAQRLLRQARATGSP